MCGRLLTLAIATLLCAGLAAAATGGRVTVFLKDGTSAQGELLESTPAGVTVQASPKVPPLYRTWSAIKRLSTGLTRERVVADWRSTPADLLCPTCNGDGTSPCPVCGGKGVDPATATTCATCNGVGTIGKCRTPHCADGKVPCPNSCLKPGDYTGKPDADGKRWKSFPSKGGGIARWSDGHIGDWIVYENGMPTDKGRCPLCDGKSVIDDPACHGTGLQTCVACKGHGVVGVDCKTCDDGRVVCPTCGGTGLKASTTQPSTNH